MTNFDKETTIKAALSTLIPSEQPVPVYHTARSGLAVHVGAAQLPDAKSNHCSEPFVSIKIDGTADYMDAQHLSEFFNTLAQSLEKASNQINK